MTLQSCSKLGREDQAFIPSQQPAIGYELLLDQVKTSGKVALFNQGQVPEEDSAENCRLTTLPAAGGMRAPVLQLGGI